MFKPQNKVWYQPDLKCCTFYPFMPNYLIGAILKNPHQVSSNTLKSLKNTIKNMRFSLPIGICAPFSYQVEFNNRGKNEFGQRYDWLCPYYDQKKQNCGIWAFRGGVCTTFFCKSSYGKEGISFWRELNSYLNYVEMALLEEALVRLDFSPRQMSDQLSYLNRSEASAFELKMKKIPLKSARKIWNGYIDDPESFYIKCFDVVTDLTKKELDELFGEQGKILLANILKRANQLL